MLRVASPLGKRLVGQTMGFDYSAFRHFMFRIKGTLQKASNRHCGRIYPKSVMENEFKRYSEIDELVNLIMDSQPVRVLELPRKQIVP